MGHISKLKSRECSSHFSQDIQRNTVYTRTAVHSRVDPTVFQIPDTVLPVRATALRHNFKYTTTLFALFSLFPPQSPQLTAVPVRIRHWIQPITKQHNAHHITNRNLPLVRPGQSMFVQQPPQIWKPIPIAKTMARYGRHQMPRS